jgi:hypothetical protein
MRQLITMILLVACLGSNAQEADSTVLVDTTISTTYSALDAENINKLRLESPVHNLDLSDLKPRQKMKLVKQLQKLEAANQKFYLKVVTKTIIKQDNNATRLTKALAQIQAERLEDSMKYAKRIIELEKKYETRQLRIEERNETKQLAIEKNAANMRKWLLLSLAANFIFTFFSVRKFFNLSVIIYGIIFYIC